MTRGLHLIALPVFVSLFASLAFAQSSTAVENLGSVSCAAIENGLGFNIDIKDEWEFKIAAAAGCTEARFQPGWTSVENMAGVMALPTADERALDWCSKYGIKPLLVAGYGPPYKSLGNFTVAQDYPAGVTAIKLNESVATVEFPYCHVMGPKNLQIVPNGRWGYYGGLIAAADPTTNTISLASATSVPLTAGEPLVINRLLYPSCATADPNDPSIVAYGKYAAFLADRIAAHQLNGRVELWNEPGWAHDPWDHRGQFYDHAPDGITTASPNFGIAEHLAPTTLPAGVRYNWGGTNKSGGRSVLNPKFMSPPITAEEVARSIACEAMHPYGNNPEDHLFDPAILASADVHKIDAATLPGESRGSNMKYGRWLDLQNPSLHFKQNVTETGTITADNVKKARFVLRQYLAMLADGFERVTFFQLAAPHAGSVESFGFVDATTQTPTEAYTAVKGLVIDDMAEISAAPSNDASDLPRVSSYSGTYPLTAVSIVGRHAKADQANSVDFVVWQRSLVPPGPVSDLAVDGATNRIRLKWSANSYSVDSTVERATVSGGPYTAIASHVTGGGYTDNTATVGTTYYYILVGNNPGGVSSNSNEVSATPGAGGKVMFNNSSRPAGADQASWLKLPSPPPGKVIVRLPPGYSAKRAWNLVTRKDVAVTVSGNTASYEVSDDPVSLAVVPTAGGY